MRCPNCSAENPAVNYCRNCGAPLTGSESGNAAPVYAEPVEVKGKGLMFVLIGLLVGLGVGASVFYFGQNRPAARQAASAAHGQEQAPPTSASSPKREDELTSVGATTAPSPPPSHARRRRAQRESSSPPELLTGDGSSARPFPSQDVAQTASAADAKTAVPADALPVPSPSQPQRRRAVQDGESESSPAPMLPASGSASSPAPPAGVAAPQVPANPQAETPLPGQYVRPAYAGPMAGMTTWTGKLDKNSTLTITGGTPSTGVITGAALPGVPVRVTIDQTNLGITEMPNASNEYRRIVLRSHSKHDKIVIHWTVVGQQ